MSEADKEGSSALVPLEEKTVKFYGDEITAALVEIKGKGDVYVPLRPLCDYLGLDWSAQYRRSKRDEVLADELISVAMTTTEIGRGKGRRDNLCLALKFLPGWLFGIDATRVKPELKEKIIRYRRECYDVLYKAFQAETETLPFAYEARAVRAYEPNPILLQIREQGLAIARMAEQQLEIEAKALEALDQAYYAHNRLNEVGKFFNRLDTRLTEVENIVKPGDIISQAQAAEIGIKVKGLAEYLTSKLGPLDSAGKVHYQSIFGELQRRFGVTSYKLIPQRDYNEVLAFLDDWRKAANN